MSWTLAVTSPRETFADAIDAVTVAYYKAPTPASVA